MALQTLPLQGAELRYDPCWLDARAADALFAVSHAQIGWERHRIRLFGHDVDSPRLSCWIGDADAAYTYSRTRFEPRPWPDALTVVRKRLQAEIGIDFNGVLANLYRDGHDAMGWHADDEPEIDPDAPIVSLSLGATRRFTLRQRTASAPHTPAQRFAIELEHGSLLLMGSGMQRKWQHALPRTARAVGPRINLTFRRIVAAAPR